MKEIALSKTGRKYAGLFTAMVSDEDYEWLSTYHWSVKINRLGANWLAYAFRSIRHEGRTINIRMHREIWERAYGPICSGFEVDHKDHGQFGGLDNRRENLRICSHATNRGNSRRRVGTISGYKGVRWQKLSRRWQAYIVANGQQRHLGCFDDPVDAAKAYDLAAMRQWGEFAHLNFSA